jgi:plasmid maintenance system killer protein
MNADAEVVSTAYPIRVIHIARRKVRMLRAMPSISDCERWKSLGFKSEKRKHIASISICDDWHLKIQHEKTEGGNILKLLDMRRENNDQ